MTAMRRGTAVTWGWLVAVCACGGTASPAHPVATGQAPEVRAATSIARSNENAKVLLELEARFNPEDAAAQGIDGHDDAITDLGPNLAERGRDAYREAERIFADRLAHESDSRVRADLEILAHAAALQRKHFELDDQYLVPFTDVAAIVFSGLTSLLDDGVPEARRRSALVRLRKYAGMEPGQPPLADLAMQRTRARLDRPGLLFPYRPQVEKMLATTPLLIEGMGKGLAKYHDSVFLAGYEEPLRRLNEQFAAYMRFVRETILPRARSDFRRPPELYELALDERGIDAPPREIAAQAHRVFAEVQHEMQVLAPRVAREKGLSVTDYRDVIRALKKNQLGGEALVAVYHQRITDLEGIIRRQHLVTLPARPMHMRLATEAESAHIPAPHFNEPPILGNTGEQGEFVLPTRLAADPTKQLDDFSYDAASWVLTAHEGRPGHDLQFSSMIEKRVSIARAIFADNSTNTEGWGLYAEELVRPYLPLDGQLICLQFRLMRAAHAFLDIELNLGLTTREEARRVLMEEAAFSGAWADQAVQRYTFFMPGQAPSYFYGFMRLSELRADTERAMGSRFTLETFHDFVLAQGLAPAPLIRKAVFDELVPKKA